MIWKTLAFLTASAVAENLYATDYSGFVYSVNFTATNGQLTKTQQVQSCGQMPSWLEFDSLTQTLFCADESFNPNGTLTTFAVTENGTLTQQAQIKTIGGGVNTVLYGGPMGNSYIAIAHYQSSAVSTFALPITSTSEAQQALSFTLPHPGPNPIRQNVPHPHQVALDPTSRFIISPDLGADLVRIYAINSTTGMLTQCPSYTAPAGSGPRHVAFWTPTAATTASKKTKEKNRASSGVCQESTATNGTTMYLASELANNVTALSVNYSSDGCLSLTPKQTAWTFAGTPPPGSAVAEVRVSGDSLFVTNRNVSTTPPLNDSIATFSLSPTNGSLSFVSTTPSYGSWPRTLSLNANGTYAAIGDQDDGAVVIMGLSGADAGRQKELTTSRKHVEVKKRESERLDGMIGKIVLGPGGTNGNGGLSSVIFESSKAGSEL